MNVPVEEIPSDVQMAYMGDGSGKVQARMYRNMEDAMTWGEDIDVAYKINKDFTLKKELVINITNSFLYVIM